MEFNQRQIKGRKILSKRKIIICSIVRDCGTNLKKNLIVIDELCSLAKECKVVIFENDSKDNTKSILSQWSSGKENIYVDMANYNVGKTIPSFRKTDVNPFYSKIRIDKMVNYRNQYMDYLWSSDMKADYLIVVDLDVAKINVSGIIDSLGQDQAWDALSANGYSYSPRFSKRYHDTYALVEIGDQEKPQTEETIKNNQYKFSFINSYKSLYKVFSAYGGLTIYRFDAIKGLKYSTLPNQDKNVEVKCEHFSINAQIQKRGFCNFYINPHMKIKYQETSIHLIIKTIERKIKKIWAKFE